MTCGTCHHACDCREEAFSDLIAAYDAYIAVLNAELNSMGGVAIVHGWRSSLIEEGKVARGRIEEIKEKWGFQ